MSDDVKITGNQSLPNSDTDPQRSAWQAEYGRAKETANDNQDHAQVALVPSGICTPGQHAELQADVDNAGKGPIRRCTQSDSIADIDQKTGRNAQCIAARNRINNACFRGGDLNHQRAVAQAQNALQNCHDVKAKAEAKAADNTNMAWTAGAAVVGGGALYWIISEGSRLFPPRNLIPVP